MRSGPAARRCIPFLHLLPSWLQLSQLPPASPPPLPHRLADLPTGPPCHLQLSLKLSVIDGFLKYRRVPRDLQRRITHHFDATGKRSLDKQQVAIIEGEMTSDSS